MNPDLLHAVIAAVIATHNRPELRAERVLASISRQTRLPDHLVVVDDSGPNTTQANADIVAALEISGTRVFYVENRRTPGASGTWNTALSYLQSVDPSVYVAILDDDDSWMPTYLRACEKVLLERDLDMVAAGLLMRHSSQDGAELLNPPVRLSASDTLVRNTHIQGSNLFVRLRCLLEAGGFDEALTSTTDRDICIRLADLGTVRYWALNERLVHHFADNDRPRLSKPGGDAKRKGLNYFYRKHRGRMSPERQTAFIDRSRRLSHCDPAGEVALPPPSPPVAKSSSERSPLTLVVGAITSPDASLVKRMLKSLAERIGDHEEVTLKVVLLGNGTGVPISRQSLWDAVSRTTKRGVDVVVKTLKQQADDIEAGVFAVSAEQLDGRKSIALSRTLLQRYLFVEAKPMTEAVVWILNDDVVLEELAYDSSGSQQAHAIDYVSEIRRLKDSGVSIALCEVTGDPPLPALSCVRTQLVDLYHNLHRLSALSSESPFPDLRDENRLARMENPDYYYDLSGKSTSHMELPFWHEAEEDHPVAGEVFG